MAEQILCSINQPLSPPFEVRWNIRNITSKMHVVELDVDYVLDAGAKVACLGRRCCGSSRADCQQAYGQARWRTCADQLLSNSHLYPLLLVSRSCGDVRRAYRRRTLGGSGYRLGLVVLQSDCG
jgi:hypothetical protein